MKSLRKQLAEQERKRLGRRRGRPRISDPKTFRYCIQMDAGLAQKFDTLRNGEKAPEFLRRIIKAMTDL